MAARHVLTSPPFSSFLMQEAGPTRAVGRSRAEMPRRATMSRDRRTARWRLGATQSHAVPPAHRERARLAPARWASAVDPSPRLPRVTHLSTTATYAVVLVAIVATAISATAVVTSAPVPGFPSMIRDGTAHGRSIMKPSHKGPDRKPTATPLLLSSHAPTSGVTYGRPFRYKRETGILKTKRTRARAEAGI